MLCGHAPLDDALLHQILSLTIALVSKKHPVRHMAASAPAQNLCAPPGNRITASPQQTLSTAITNNSQPDNLASYHFSLLIYFSYHSDSPFQSSVLHLPFPSLAACFQIHASHMALPNLTVLACLQKIVPHIYSDFCFNCCQRCQKQSNYYPPAQLL